MARALITGCSTGIGRATAVELQRRGYEVVATARRVDVLDDLDVALRLPLDVTSDASVAEAVAAAGQIDVLVNNAGIDVGGPVERVPLGRAQAMFDTNLWGAVRMVQAVVPGMRQRSQGAVVNVTSIAGRSAAPLSAFYAASKWALEAVTESLQHELRHFGIRVVAIEPGFIDTPILVKESRVGTDRAPYDELATEWDAAIATLNGESIPGPELVAAAIADVLEEESPALRHPVGEDAKMIAGLRDDLGYEDFVATMRQALGLTW